MNFPSCALDHTEGQPGQNGLVSKTVIPEAAYGGSRARSSLSNPPRKHF